MNHKSCVIFLPSLLDAHIIPSSVKWVAGGIFMQLKEKTKSAKRVIASCKPSQLSSDGKICAYTTTFK